MYFGGKPSFVLLSDEKNRIVNDLELQPEAFQSAAVKHTRKTPFNYRTFFVSLQFFITTL